MVKTSHIQDWEVMVVLQLEEQVKKMAWAKIAAEERDIAHRELAEAKAESQTNQEATEKARQNAEELQRYCNVETCICKYEHPA